MDKEFFKGKKIGELADEDTVIQGGDAFRDGFEPLDVVIQSVSIQRGGPYLVMGEYIDEFVLCYCDGKLKTVFWVYDLEYVSLNPGRGVVIAGGHDTLHVYWFDDGEYSKEYTR